MMFSRLRWSLGLLALFGVLQSSLAADDPPGRVGRLSLAEGNVTFRADRQEAGSPAAVNWPISSGAILATERQGRAEVWIGSSTYRLGPNSRAEFVTVDDRFINLQLTTGMLAVTIRDRSQAEDLEINTPGGRVRFAEPGRYRIEVRPGSMTVAAQSGTAEVSAGGQPVAVRPGQMAISDGNGAIDIGAAPYGDEFDTWVTDQDNRDRSSATRHYVSPYMTGYQELDAHGDWSAAGDFGSVWYPRVVAADWAPYRDGRWAWVAPWGWTWIDAAPWGFAPFHYGRWVQVRGRWGWAPGTYVARPVYAPALVGWVGNPGWTASFRSGSAPAVGWFPLAPREVYVPAYRTSPTYIRQINVTHVSNVGEIDRAVRPDYRPHYAHQGQPHAVTVVPSSVLREGRPTSGAAVRSPDQHQLGQAPMTARAPGREWLAPTAEAMRPSPRGEADRVSPGQVLPAPSDRRQQQPGNALPLNAEPRRDMAPPATRPSDAGTRWPSPATSSAMPESGRQGENRGRVTPPPEERGWGRAAPNPSPLPEAPRTERERPSPALSAPIPHENQQRPTPPVREIQQPQAVHREPPREMYREVQGERPAPIVREVPRAMPQAPAPNPLPPPETSRVERERRMPAMSAPLPRENQQRPAPPVREIQQQQPVPREAPRERPPPLMREAPRATPQPQQPVPVREMQRGEQRAAPRGDPNRGGNPGSERRGEKDPH